MGKINTPFGEVVIDEAVIEKLVADIKNEEELVIKERQETIKGGAMEDIFGFLIGREDDPNEFNFVWGDDFLYYCGPDEDQKQRLGRQIDVMAREALLYVENHEIEFNYTSDNCFLSGFALFKYKDTIFYVEEMTGQGTCTGIGILNNAAINDLHIDLDNNDILDYEEIIKDTLML